MPIAFAAAPALGFGKGASIATIGTIVSAVGSIAQGIQASNAADFQATVQRQQAERERQVAELEETDFRRRQSRLIAARRAALGGSGVEPGAGSPLLVGEDIAGEVELQALRLRAGGKAKATRLEQQATLTGLTGRRKLSSGLVRGGSLLFDAASKQFG